MSANVCSDTSHILKQTYPEVDKKKVQLLQSSAVLTLLSLLEGCSNKMLPSLMVDTISIDSTATILETLWQGIQVALLVNESY